MEQSFAQLDALVSLITSAVADVKAEYTRLRISFPDLGDVKSHPLDSMPIPHKLKKATEIVNGACTQLSTLLLSPQHALYLRANDYLTSVAIRVAHDSKVADQLKENSDGLHVSHIALQSGIDEEKMSRLLRLLATKHCFQEVKKDVFANNRLSILLTSENAVASTIGVSVDEQFDGSSCLYETLVDKITGPSSSPKHSSFAKSHRGYPLWDFYREVDPARGKRFAKAMAGFGHTLNTESMIHGFPWKSLPAGTTICDVGSGVGYMCMDIARLNPGVHIVLQDLGETIEHARDFWEDNASEILAQGRVQFVPIDFFKEAPVAHCDFYYMKHIIHNWPDEANKTLLSNIKRAMKPGSRLIIQEYVMQHLSHDAQDDMIERAPDPLLPNFGEGRILEYYLDLAMMILVNSRERTLAEFRALGNAVGLQVTKVWNCGELSALECRLSAD